MKYHAVAAVLMLAAPLRAFAANSGFRNSFDTIDSVEISNLDVEFGQHSFLTVRGILRGQSTPVSLDFDFGTNKDMATRCERLALIAMSKPGKYQFDIGANNSGSTDGGHGDCRLTLVAP